MTATADPRSVSGLPHKNATPALACVGLAKRFPVHRSLGQTLLHPMGTEWVPSLNGVTLEVARGEFFGVLGPNGAGKTTLFRLITGLVTPDQGSVLINGHDVAKQTRAARSQLGVVFANERAMNWRLDARQNLKLFAALYAVPREQEDARIEAVLRQVELDDTGGKLAGTFSSGMKQRLSLARALLTDPPVLLLDEPTRSLDPVSAQRFRDFLKAEVATRGRTVILATHSAEEAFGLCDRVLVLDRGTPLAIDSAHRLAEEYADRVYRAWTDTPDHPALVARRAGMAPDSTDIGGWSVVEFPAFESEEAAAEVLRQLVDAGVRVSRFERAGISLGQLLERMVARRRSVGT